MSDDLKPCPFCGSKVEKEGYGHYHLGDEWQSIQCKNSKCRVSPGIIQDQDDYGQFDIVEEWNERA